jgi:hypothetical protein
VFFIGGGMNYHETRTIKAAVKALRDKADALEKLIKPEVPLKRGMTIKQSSKSMKDMTAAEKRKLAPYGGKRSKSRENEGRRLSRGEF